jgi:hypothetical protein
VSHDVVHIVDAEAITVTVPEMIATAARSFYGDASPYSLELPVI